MHGNSTQGGTAGQEVGERLVSAATALLVAKAYRPKARQVSAETRARFTTPVGGVTPTNLLDDPQYPQTWDDYIGQRPAKDMLKSAVRRAKERNETVRHVLISCGIPGVGKTALAVLLAREIGGRCFTITGTPNAAQVRDLLLSTRPGDVLFIDEIHRLANGGGSKSEWLLHVLQDDAYMDGTGIVKADLGITVVGASTDAETLPEPILDRFGVKPVLTQYEPDDAARIAAEECRRLFPPTPLLSIEDLVRLTYAADCNPRRIKQLMEQALDMHYDPAGYDCDRLLRRAGMTEDGLDTLAQRYLTTLLSSRGAMGEAQLRARLQTPNLAYCERRLADKGLINFTATGRSLTASGNERAMELVDDARQ